MPIKLFGEATILTSEEIKEKHNITDEDFEDEEFKDFKKTLFPYLEEEGQS